MIADLYKLVYGTHTGKYGPLTNSYMSRHLGVITYNTIITHQAIMGKMRISHNQAIFSDYSFFPVGRAAVYGYKFPDRSIITNYYSRIFTMKLKILWYGGNNCSRKDPAILTDPGTFHNGYIGTYPGAIANFHVLVNDRERVNFDIGGQFGIRMNICMRMNHGFL